MPILLVKEHDWRMTMPLRLNDDPPAIVKT